MWSDRKLICWFHLVYILHCIVIRKVAASGINYRIFSVKLFSNCIEFYESFKHFMLSMVLIILTPKNILCRTIIEWYLSFYEVIITLYENVSCN